MVLAVSLNFPSKHPKIPFDVLNGIVALRPVSRSVLQMWQRAAAEAELNSLARFLNACQCKDPGNLETRRFHYLLNLLTLLYRSKLNLFNRSLHIYTFQTFSIITDHLYTSLSIRPSVLLHLHHLLVSLSLPPMDERGGLLDERLRLEKSHRARRSQPSIFLPVIPPFTLSCSPPLSLPPCLFSIYVCPSPTRPSLIPFSGEAGQVWWPSVLLRAIKLDQYNSPLRPLFITPLSG